LPRQAGSSLSSQTLAISSVKAEFSSMPLLLCLRFSLLFNAILGKAVFTVGKVLVGAGCPSFDSQRTAASHRGSLLVKNRGGPIPCLVSQSLTVKNAQRSLVFGKAAPRKSVLVRPCLGWQIPAAQPRMQMRVSKSGFSLLSPLAGLGIQGSVFSACHQLANPSIERTSKGYRPRPPLISNVRPLSSQGALS